MTKCTDNLTLGELRELLAMFGGASAPTTHPYKIGQSYLIRTVTHYHTGRLVAVHAGELVLDDAAWIADCGRYHDALAQGTLTEVEPIIGPCVVNRGAIVDAVEWRHDLPSQQK